MDAFTHKVHDVNEHRKVRHFGNMSAIISVLMTCISIHHNYSVRSRKVTLEVDELEHNIGVRGCMITVKPYPLPCSAV